MLFRWRADHGPQGRAAAQAASLLCRPVGFAKRGLHPGESLAWIAPSGGARSPRGHAIGAVAMAVRRIAGDGTELFEAVAPSFFATAVLTARSGDVEIVEIDALIARPSGAERRDERLPRVLRGA